MVYNHFRITQLLMIKNYFLEHLREILERERTGNADGPTEAVRQVLGLLRFQSEPRLNLRWSSKGTQWSASVCLVRVPHILVGVALHACYQQQ